ncbi:MAG: rRNA maturation RNase YbeY [Syntrophorhabdaceae bacterium]|nr:rRNA maturation RNase YbeY [Syntrophorhabdaceae bacterium]
MLTYLGLKDRELSLFFVNNNQIKKINKRWFDKDRATNVISFSYLSSGDGFSPSIPHDGEGEKELIGDIVISLERAEEESIDAQCAFYERLFALIVHGIVHILGYDHEKDKKEARRMRYMEKKLLSFIKSRGTYIELLEKKTLQSNKGDR